MSAETPKNIQVNFADGYKAVDLFDHESATLVYETPAIDAEKSEKKEEVEQ